MNFLELTLQDGRKLDIPPFSVQFVEGLDPESRKANEGCQAGLFYDVGGMQPQPGGGFGEGTLKSAVVQETYANIAKAVRLSSPTPRVELTTALGESVLLETNRILSLQDLLADHPNGAKCTVTHLVGARMLPLDVNETRDEIRAAMADASPPQPEPTPERA